MRIQVWWDSPNGHRLFLSSGREKGILFSKPNGLVAKPSRESTKRSNGVGEDYASPTYAAIEGSLDLTIYGDSIGDAYLMVADAFPAGELGRLSVTDSRGNEWGADFFPSPLGNPEKSPRGTEVGSLQVQVELTSPDGVFSSPTEVLSGGTVSVVNIGDLPLYPQVVWSGSGETVTLPSGVTVNLPAVSAERVMSTDPGEGFAIRDRSGAIDYKAWRTMRGLPVPGETLKGSPTSWKLSSGVRLELVHRVENPWR